MHYVYALKDPRTRKARYIGVTNNPVQRLVAHVGSAGSKRRPKDLWILELKSLGLRPLIEVVETHWDYAVACDAEEAMIALFMRHAPRGLILNRASTSPRKYTPDSESVRTQRHKDRMRLALEIVESIPELAQIVDERAGPSMRVNRHNSEEWSRYLAPEAVREYLPMI